MRVFALSNCTSGFLQCGNLPNGACCNLGDTPAASLIMRAACLMSRESLSSGFCSDYPGWGNAGCTGPRALRAIGLPGGISPNCFGSNLLVSNTPIFLSPPRTILTIALSSHLDFFGNWHVIDSGLRRRDASDATAASAESCVDPDRFGYINVSGEEDVAKFPRMRGGRKLSLMRESIMVISPPWKRAQSCGLRSGNYVQSGYWN